MSISMTLIRGLHQTYKIFLSPFFGNRCRFHPTCSDYSLQAMETHGIIFGSLLAMKRILRCNPLSSGGFDAVPEKSCCPTQSTSVLLERDSLKETSTHGR